MHLEGLDSADPITDRLRSIVLTGEIEPGSRIDQAATAARLGVSVVPLREALARLEGTGLVRAFPRRGWFAAPLAAADLADIYSLREPLEAQVARAAAPLLSTADIAALEATAQRLREGAGGDSAAFLDLNRELHFTIYRAAAGPHMLRTLTQMWDLSERYRRLQLRSDPARAAAALGEIDAIVDCARRRDGESLALMIRYKLRQTVAGLGELLAGWQQTDTAA